MHGHLATRADSPVGRSFSGHPAHRRPGTSAVRAPDTGHAQARCPERRNGRALEGWSDSAAEPTGRNQSRQQPRTSYWALRTAGPTHMSATMSLRSNSGAAQAERRGVRLPFLTGALHRRTGRAQGRIFPGCLPSRPANLTPLASSRIRNAAPRAHGCRPRAANREQQARRGWGGAAVDQLARDLKAFFPRTTGFSAARLRRAPVPQKRHCAGLSRTACARRRAQVRMPSAFHGAGGRRHGGASAGPTRAPSPAVTGTGRAASENAIGSALGAIRVHGVKA